MWFKIGEIFHPAARKSFKILLAEAAVAIGAADYEYDYIRGGLYGPGNPMYGIGVRRLLAYNFTRMYSPIILNNGWPTLLRLIFIIFFTFIGTILNGFFVSSFFIERPLRKLGNVYLACIGLADMVITTGVMPTSAVVLLSGVWDLSPVCYSLQFLAQASTYSYSLFFMMIAIETYIRLCRTRACYAKFISIPVSFISFMTFGISFTVSGVGVYLSMDYDYCQREHVGNYTFRVMTSVVFHAIPFLVTVILLLTSSLVVRSRARRLIHYKRSQQFERDYSFTNLNIACYTLFVAAWIPYLVIVNEYPNTTDGKFYNCVWVGVSRSIITSFLYSGLNRNFRRAFAHLFYYCCCKSSITAPFNNRHRNVFEYKVATGDVRVHIMHHTMAASSPQRALASTSRETHSLEL